MPDSKYGRIFTEEDVEKILEYVGGTYDGEVTSEEISAGVEVIMKEVTDGKAGRMKFDDPNEPLFVLRGRDKRAVGAVRHYRDHQSPRAPDNHRAACDHALDQFENFRIQHANLMKEPD